MSETAAPRGRKENVAYLLRWLADALERGDLSEEQLALTLSTLAQQLDPGAPRRSLEEAAATVLRLARQMPAT